jgi:predicted esterase
VFISHGTKDQAAKYELGVKSNEVLNSYGYGVSFNSFEGGHTNDPENLKRLLGWIKKA